MEPRILSSGEVAEEDEEFEPDQLGFEKQTCALLHPHAISLAFLFLGFFLGSKVPHAKFSPVFFVLRVLGQQPGWAIRLENPQNKPYKEPFWGGGGV